MDVDRLQDGHDVLEQELPVRVEKSENRELSAEPEAGARDEVRGRREGGRGRGRGQVAGEWVGGYVCFSDEI